MALFGSVSSKQVDEFAKSLVDELVKHYPPEADVGTAEKKPTQKKVASMLEGLFVRATEFKKQHRLGIYKTARLGNSFRWEMKERGYDPKFIEVMVEGLVLRLSVK